MKTAKRKPKRIAHPKQKPIDDDLRALVEELDENRLDLSVEGWFEIPWRDGWNAIEMALKCFETNLDEFASEREKAIWNFIVDVLGTRAELRITLDANTYWTAGEHLSGASVDSVSPHLIAALRCLQVCISNSSGGGEVYNVVLKIAFDRVEPSSILADVVREYRCRDAIGTTAVMQSDRHDKTRRAFDVAWRRGLFHAAYALPVVGGSKT